MATVTAPVYRYFTADLLTNEILEEIPFRGVSYQRALNGAGSFSGSIPTSEQTNYLNLYSSTTPGNTALYIVRNGICVWGGIIWSRSYDVVQKTLSVNGSEFPSYLYHRKIWKTYSHTLGSTLTVESGVGTVDLDLGFTSGALKSGRTVDLQFFDFRYDGIYTIASSPAPTTKQFTLSSLNSVVTLSSASVADNVVTITTVDDHKLRTDDLVTIDSSLASINGPDFKITASAVDGKQFSYSLTLANSDTTTITGTGTRTIPDGTYDNVNVSVRTDTYDYIRDLLSGMASDFVGVDFPNVYIEPGLSYSLDIVSKTLANGYATITTAQPHNLVTQQAVQIKNVDDNFDGEYRVYSVPSPTTFTFEKTGTLAQTAVAKSQATITEMVAVDGLTTVTTSAAHGYRIGQTVEVNTQIGSLGYAGYFNGMQKITDVTATTFTYQEPSKASVPKTTFNNATATVGASASGVVQAKLASNVATITTDKNHGFAAGNSVVVANVSPLIPISSRALRVASGAGTATVRTGVTHKLNNSDVVDITGLQDAAFISSVYVKDNIATLKTARSVNFKNGDTITVSGISTPTTVTHKSRASNSVTLTLKTDSTYKHPFSIGDEAVIQDIYDYVAVQKQRIGSEVATLTVPTGHGITVGAKIEVEKCTDSEVLISKRASRGYATVTTSGPHNFSSGDTVTITGAGVGFNGEHRVTEPITSNSFSYEVVLSEDSEKKPDKKTVVKEKSISGAVTTNEAIFNGDFEVSAVSATTVSYQINNSYDSPLTTSAASARIVFLSPMNGTYTLTGASTTQITYTQNGAEVSNAAVERPNKNVETPYPQATPKTNILNDDWTITKVDGDTLKFAVTPPRNFKTDPVLAGIVIKNSIFNGTNKTISNATNDVFDYSAGVQTTSITEDVVNSVAYAKATSIYNGTKTILSSPAPTAKTFSYSVTHDDRSPELIISQGSATVRPVAIASTFGPFPGSADIGLLFSTREASGVNTDPPIHRGFELTTVGEALEKYASSVDGFDYRIDCEYDESTMTFTKTFIMLPLQYPNPPAEGVVSPVSRFGADEVVFEYPGNIGKFSVNESAENAATRMFVVGNENAGDDYGSNIGVAALTDFLDGSRGRKWPLLDFDEKADDANNKTVLYGYARRYALESAPPMADFAISVNGALEPIVGSYAPGDWCSIVVRDPFIQARLSTDLEPRDTVLVRKIESYSVNVPDGVTFPEEVTLTIIPEWEVDGFGD
jgi:hypothetical protein